MTEDTLLVMVAFAAGLGLGAAYLGSLWAVVRRLPRSRRPGLWLLVGAALRLGLLLGALAWIADGRWERLLAALLGVVLLRLAATRWAADGAKRPLAS